MLNLTLTTAYIHHSKLVVWTWLKVGMFDDLFYSKEVFYSFKKAQILCKSYRSSFKGKSSLVGKYKQETAQVFSL